MDTVDPATRSRMMAGVKGKNTKPEIEVRKSLFRKGFRYRINDRRYPGKPDVVLPKYKAIIFVHGCFWHGHDCGYFRLPATRPDFWEAKIATNITRDANTILRLRAMDWRICVVWECSLRGRARLHRLEIIANSIEAWLISKSDYLELDRASCQGLINPS